MGKSNKIIKKTCGVENMSEHAKLSASSSKKWLNCPLSVTLEGYFEDEESSYAKEGTIAHSLGELKLKTSLGRITRSDYIFNRDTLLKDFSKEDEQEIEHYTEEYADFVIERYNNALSNCEEAEILIEERLDYSKYAKEGFGTGDVVICDYESIEIIDLKYGKGVKVDAFENSQLMLYGLGALEIYGDLFDIKTVKMTIFQPRLDNISTYELDTQDLLNWGKNVVYDKAEQAFDGVGECCYGSHCDEGFCKAKPLCKTYTKHHTQVSKYKSTHPSLLTDEELVDIYDLALSYDKWIKSIKSYILQKMLEGKKLPGLKLVEGRSNRTFTDEKAIIKALKDNGYKKSNYIVEKLISITEAEKLLGKVKFEEILGTFVIKPPGAPTVAKIEDKRPEYNSAELDFKNIEV